MVMYNIIYIFVTLQINDIKENHTHTNANYENAKIINNKRKIKV